jgi:glutamate dehydrogenase
VKELSSLLADDDSESVATSFAARAPASYRDQTSPAEAARDIGELAALRRQAEQSQAGRSEATGVGTFVPVFGGPHRLVVRPSTDDGCLFRIRRYGEGRIELTRFLPVLESFGLVVVQAVPLHVDPGSDGEPAAYIDDIGVRTEAPHGPEALRFVPGIHGPRLVDAIEAIARGAADLDSLNRLVTVAGFDWRQVMVLRTYLRYWMQCRTGLTWSELADPLVDFPDVARALIAQFQARFDPAGPPPADTESLPGLVERRLCLAELDLVPQLEQDQVLRGYLGLVDATLRTNFYQTDAAGNFHPTLVIKLDSHAVPELPAPRPRVEAFVHGPTVEGIHLRAGLIARGGLRWSERPSDFRTEVLDLAFAQVKKNAIIVPTGAKGGFVARTHDLVSKPTPDQVRRAYQDFVESLLEITDNIVGGEVVTPPRVLTADGPDPYLVVAADKGTAKFSDLANSISENAGFWLGDAFASGGSRGYDHKAMGITARGAWVAVRRHFRELGIDVQADPVRVAGVGDMSGDVFGNGMLQSAAIKLVAAFDHRHVFIDPDPDPVVAFAERARLARLAQSSWGDYREDAISPGGGVWPRDAKSIALSPAARRAIGVEAATVSPPELISAILSAPVDLLWFGGIGTYIKAPGESDVDVADRANDNVRITSDLVRARVIAEGANLGITQLARIRYSRRGGRINADFIDNAAGVATSDREVNLKLLLGLAIEEGRLDPADRDDYLKRSEQEVAEEVLRAVDHSVAVLNRAAAGSARELDAYEALLETVEADGRLDRIVECLPSREEMRVRRAAGAGLIRPELAVLLAYAKSDLVAAIEASPVVADQSFLDSVVPYFPLPVRESFEDLIPRLRLYPQLVSTDVGGELVDQMGIVWAHETSAELGRGLDEVAAAFWMARRVVGAGELWRELEDLAAGLSADAEAALHATVTDAVDGLARAYLTRSGSLDMAAVTARDAEMAAELDPAAAERLAPERAALEELGVPADVAARFLGTVARASVADAGPVRLATGRSGTDVVQALALLDEAAGLAQLVTEIDGALSASPAPERFTTWHARALLDDISSWRRTAAIAALGPPGAGGGGSPAQVSVPEAIETWAGARQDDLARVEQLQETLDRETVDPLAVASLVLRRLHQAL